jgi:glycosyltransferase involved in cell wall biosynthesis
MFKVSLVTTVFNERDSIEGFLNSIISQSRVPDEFIILDGFSNDGTYEIICNYAENHSFIVLLRERCGIARGRNLAIARSTGEVIATTDAGCVVETSWLEHLVQPFDDGAFLAAYGNFEIIGDSRIQRVYAAIQRRRSPEKNYPSSRSFAFRKHLWEICPYPEDLVVHEDSRLCMTWNARGISFGFIEKALVGWVAESSLRKIFKKHSRYAFWTALSGDFPQRFHGFVCMSWTLFFYISLASPLVASVLVFSYVLFRVFRGKNSSLARLRLGPSSIGLALPVVFFLDAALIFGSLGGLSRRIMSRFTGCIG